MMLVWEIKVCLVAVLILIFAGFGVAVVAEYCRNRYGWGLKYPREGKFGTYYYEFHKRTPRQSMRDVQDALDDALTQVVFDKKVFAKKRLLQRVKPTVYFGDVFADGVWQGTLRVSRTREVPKSIPDPPLERLDVLVKDEEVVEPLDHVPDPRLALFDTVVEKDLPPEYLL